MAISIGTIAPASPPQQTNSNNNTSHSYNVTCTSDTDVVVIFAASFNSGAASGNASDRASATWNASPLTELDWYTQGGSFGDDQPMQAWLVTSPGAGTHALQITTPAAGGSTTREFLSVAIPLEGVDLTALPTAFETNGATTGTSPSITVATAVDNLVLAMGTTWDIGQSAHTGTVIAQYDELSDNSAYAAWNVQYRVATGTSTSVGWTAASSDDWMIVALEFVPAAGGTDVTGTASSTITASASASGAVAHTGTAASTITASATAAGAPGKTGTAASTITATATAAGAVGHAGAAASTITASASASGDVAHTGAASSTITASGTGSGVRGVTGAGSSTITASGTAAGDSTSPGSGAGSSTITASATASGVRGVTGAGSSTITATATATDGAEPPSGAGSSTITASAIAAGVVGHVGTAASTVTVAATASGARGVLGAGTSTITATATIVIDVPDVPDERTITVAAENRTITVAAESRVVTAAESRTVTVEAGD